MGMVNATVCHRTTTRPSSSPVDAPVRRRRRLGGV